MAVQEDLERIALQEQELQLISFDALVAWNLGVKLRNLAGTRNLPIVIDIRRFGQPLFYAAMPGTTPDNFEWVRRKSNLVARLHRSSYAIGLGLKAKKETVLEKYGLPTADFVGAWRVFSAFGLACGRLRQRHSLWASATRRS